MKVVNLSEENSIFNSFIRELRDVNVQNDRMRFRRNLERIGEVMAYEMSKDFPFETIEVTTPLGITKETVIAEQPVIATILRAGLPMHIGFLNYFDRADNSFISAYRKHVSKKVFKVEIEYLSSPKIDDRILILNDPMIASGSSMVLAYRAMLNKGKPKHIHVACIIASREGLEHVKANMPKNSTIWVGAIDDELTAQSYIVPGLGDAGDLAFGSKE
ncbi:MAG: uracil phosphoribosyltransferase [Flavobacteriales bacterium]|nr:uracil phosphoribosyltransferase [Flavobacteriales bacterium]